MARTNAAAFIVVLAAALAGCTESTQVRSYPAGSKVYINDSFVGLTPLYYQVPNAEFERDFQVRIEHPGYQSAQGELKKEVSRGRIAGGVFTFGILLLFKSTTCFSAVQDFALTELEGGTSTKATGDAPSPEVRLQRLDAMRQQGIITDEEFRHHREAILQEP